MQSKHLKLMGAELRMFESGWIFLSFAPTMCWRFPRTDKQAGSKTQSEFIAQGG